MVEYEIEHLSKQYKELYHKLRSAAYSLLDAEYVAEELKKVTIKQIELTNKIIKNIT